MASSGRVSLLAVAVAGLFFGLAGCGPSRASRPGSVERHRGKQPGSFGIKFFRIDPDPGRLSERDAIARCGARPVRRDVGHVRIGG